MVLFLSLRSFIFSPEAMEPHLVSETDNLILLALKSEQAGDISGALRQARQALDAARAANLPLECARALTAVARYRFRLGQYETARQLAQEAQAMTDPIQEAQAAVHAEALLLLGMCALETNSLTECETYYRSAANLAREIGHTLLFQRALHNLGSAVYLFHGQFDLAIATDSQSLQICRENGYADWAMFPLITLAIAYQITGQQLRTRATLMELRAMAQPGSAGEGYACYVSGMLALDEDDFLAADAELTRARTLAETLGDPSLNLDARLGISRMCRLGGEGSRALAWAEDALNFAQRVGYRIYQGRAWLERGRAAWLMDDLITAETDLNQAEAIFSEMDLRYDLAGVRLLLAALYQQQKDPRTAVLLPHVAAAIQAGGYGFLVERERSLVYPLAAYLNNPDPQVAGAAGQLLDAIQCVPPKPLRITTFGGLAVWIGAQMVNARSLRQRRTGELLALLLSSPGHTLSAEQVTEAMCPEKDPQAAVNFYHHAISALRRLLEPDLPDRRFPCRYLEVSEERVTLIIPPGSKIDFLEFERAVQNKAWEKAAAIYQGEYLPMYCYAEWSIALRQHLSDQFEQALLAQATACLNGGDAAACLDLARQALLHNGWLEQAVELGMRAALQLSDRVTALKLYQRLEKKLEKELGIAPQTQLQVLYKIAQKRSG
jgi:DNA-binding SARP family transcriptional activator